MDILIQDDIMFPAMKKNKQMRAWAFQYVAEAVAEELEELRVKSKLFSKFDPETSIEHMDVLLEATTTMEEQAPLLSNLVRNMCWTRGGHYRPQGRVALIASVLQLCRHRETANNFSRLLGLYLKDLGLKRRGLCVLHGLGLIDSYFTLNSLHAGLTKRAKVGSDDLINKRAALNAHIEALCI